jgi:NAD+ kinase
MRIGIIYKEEDKLISGTAKKVISELKALGHKAIVLNEAQRLQNVQFVITFGGDGTILRAARIVCKKNIPILPVHLGGLGLLTEISITEIERAVKLIQEKKYHLDSRMMLEALVLKNNKILKSSIALNDVVIGKSSIARTVKLEAYIGGKSIANYVGDGLVISTPTGSTAYNFAVNGPIIPPQGKSYIISPICPHRAANRSIVLDEPVLIKIQKGDEMLMTIDGQETFKLDRDEIIKIQKSKYKTDFIRLKEYNIWELLRSKMGWG